MLTWHDMGTVAGSKWDTTINCIFVFIAQSLVHGLFIFGSEVPMSPWHDKGVVAESGWDMAVIIRSQQYLCLG